MWSSFLLTNLFCDISASLPYGSCKPTYTHFKITLLNAWMFPYFHSVSMISQEQCFPHNPQCFFSPPSPQETEISTRRKECEALEAEVKKKNQTCQTLVSAPQIHPDHWMKGWSLKLISTWKHCSRSHHTHQSLEAMSCSDSWVLVVKT